MFYSRITINQWSGLTQWCRSLAFYLIIHHFDSVESHIYCSSRNDFGFSVHQIYGPETRSAAAFFPSIYGSIDIMHRKVQYISADAINLTQGLPLIDGPRSPSGAALSHFILYPSIRLTGGPNLLQQSRRV